MHCLSHSALVTMMWQTWPLRQRVHPALAILSQCDARLTLPPAQIWPKVHNQILFSLVLAQLVLVFILAIKKVIMQIV